MSDKPEKPKCKDCRDFGLDVDADERYTLDFTDVEPGAYIHFCEQHGIEAKKMDDALKEAFASRPGFAQQLQNAMDKRSN